MSDARYERASQHAADVLRLADELDTAISLAQRDGYHATVRLTNAKRLSAGCYIGHGDRPVRLKATVALDLGKAVR